MPPGQQRPQGQHYGQQRLQQQAGPSPAGSPEDPKPWRQAPPGRRQQQQQDQRRSSQQDGEQEAPPQPPRDIWEQLDPFLRDEEPGAWRQLQPVTSRSRQGHRPSASVWRAWLEGRSRASVLGQEEWHAVQRGVHGLMGFQRAQVGLRDMP
jgi:hypothetical protein